MDMQIASLLAGILWVFAASVTACLPMRYQYAPGLTLLLLAPAIIAWLAVVHGWLLMAVGLFAFVSMFRNPLLYLLSRLKGETPDLPR